MSNLVPIGAKEFGEIERAMRDLAELKEYKESLDLAHRFSIRVEDNHGELDTFYMPEEDNDKVKEFLEKYIADHAKKSESVLKKYGLEFDYIFGEVE